MRGSLAGIRVLDLTTSVAGPFATMILADLGAEVIKVERPGVGDDTRHWGPPRWPAVEAAEGQLGESCHFNALNRGKRSIALNLRDPVDIGLTRQLAERADILVQNLRPGTLDARGLGFDELRLNNPGLIYVSITGYGSSGPLAKQPAYDPLMQAFSGLMSMVGAPGSDPARIPVSILDQGSGMWAVIGALNALRNRAVTGHGEHVQTSLLGTALMWQPAQVANYFAAGELPVRLGSGTIGIYPYGHFPTATQDIVIAAGNQRLWEKLCEVLECPQLPAEPHFATNETRVAHREELLGVLSVRLRERDSATWLQMFDAAGVPAAPINRLDDVLNHEQLYASGVVAGLEHPRIRNFKTVLTPLGDEDGPLRPGAPAPELDEHGAQIRAEIADALLASGGGVS